VRRGRLPGVGAGAHRRLSATGEHGTEGKGKTIWGDGDGVLIAGYQNESAGENRTPFFGIKGPGWVYVEPRGQPPRYYADPGEQTNAIDTIDQPAYAAWLAALRAA
jgi:hypothetical protein